MSTDLDTTTFNTPNGYVITDFDTIITPTTSSKGKVIVLQPDGKIVMAGKFFDSTLSPLPGIEIVAVCRYLSNGTLDSGFGTLGKVTQLLGAGFPNNISIYEVTGITLQSDGKIVICGYQTFPGSIGPPVIPATTNIFVLRLTPAGVLDTTFNSGAVLPAAPGYLYTTPAEFTSVFSPSLNSTDCSVEAIAMQTIGANEFIVIGGAASMYQPPASSATAVAYYALARYTLLGVLDPTFGSSGLVVQSFLPILNHFGIDLYVDSTQILLAGVKYYTPPINVTSRMTVVKFNGGGILDSTWGTNGNGLTDIPNFFVSSQDTANAIQVQSDGKIILGGTSTNNSLPYQQRCFVLARLLSTGAIDTPYGIGGVVITDLSPSYNLYGNTMGKQPDDKIVLGGSFDTFFPTPKSFALARYDTTGTLDTTFGLAGTGLVLEDIIPSNPSYVEEGFSLAIQPDGKILLGGTFQNNRQFSFILARYFGFPPYPPPVVPICFPAGTPVLTDQGNIPIELIDPNVHTIKKKPIIAITQSFMNEDTIVCIEKHSLGINIPNKRTYISNYHGILYKNNLIPAKQLVGRLRGIYHVKYNNQILYNVLMEKHYIMNVNNMSVETLNPKNIVAKLYTNEHSPEEKMKLILEINEITKNNKNKNKNNCENYNGYEKITQNFTRRKFSILRYNPLINRLNFYTKKHFVSQNNPYNNTIKNHVSFKKYNPNVKLNTHKFRYGRRIR
jgi:uncharacterized delta-60 repeat protein